jgi:hypothetical protein
MDVHKAGVHRAVTGGAHLARPLVPGLLPHRAAARLPQPAKSGQAEVNGTAGTALSIDTTLNAEFRILKISSRGARRVPRTPWSTPTAAMYGVSPQLPQPQPASPVDFGRRNLNVNGVVDRTSRYSKF